MDELLRNLLDALDAVGEAHEEIYDTECRERMSEPIFHLFIKPAAEYVFPDDFGLYTEEANLQVKAALDRYIQAANEIARKEQLNGFHDRLSAFQNDSVESNIARTYFDDYFGWMNPANLDQNGDVIGRN